MVRQMKKTKMIMATILVVMATIKMTKKYCKSRLKKRSKILIRVTRSHIGCCWFMMMRSMKTCYKGISSTQTIRKMRRMMMRIHREILMIPRDP